MGILPLAKRPVSRTNEEGDEVVKLDVPKGRRTSCHLTTISSPTTTTSLGAVFVTDVSTNTVVTTIRVGQGPYIYGNFVGPGS